MDTTKSKGTVRRASAFVLQGLNQLLWPAVCINCGRGICETDNALCRRCWDELLACTGGDYCGRCGREASRFGLVEGACAACQSVDFHFDRVARAGVYAGSLREMILGFKRGRTELDSVLGFLGSSALQGGGFCGEVEIFVPVPLHWSRRLARGYNQSLILAKRLRHQRAGISTDLVRVRRTKFQPTMTTPAARARNVAGAFAVRKGHNLAGRAVCLVDDIKTTGATLNECAKTLKEAGAAKVFGLVLAVAGQGQV